MKISKIYAFAATIALSLGLASCSDVTDPVLQKPDPAKFTIYNPPLQDQYFELNPNGTFELTLNGQPDYGFSAITQYRAEVCMSPDFVQNEDGSTNYRVLTPTGTGTLSRMTLKMEDLAIAMNEMAGVTSKDDYVDRGIEKVYIRGVAFISGVDDSYVTTSNVVSLNKVQAYYCLRLPAYLYCIGNYLTDWIGPVADNEVALIPYRVSEDADAIGSNVFHATIDFGTNAPIFRFYTHLDGWDAPADFDGTGKTGLNAFFTLGASGGENNDTPVPFPDFTAGSNLTHKLAETKDSFSFPNYTGTVKMTVDLSDVQNPAATFDAVQ